MSMTDIVFIIMLIVVAAVLVGKCIGKIAANEILKQLGIPKKERKKR